MSQTASSDNRAFKPQESKSPGSLRSPVQNREADSQLRNIGTSPPPAAPPYPYNERSPTQLQPLQPSQGPYNNAPYYQLPYQPSYPPRQSQYGPGSGASIHQNTPTSASSATPPHGETPKRSRLARACDQCSERKVKCDSLGPPCKPCRDLGLPCTNNRETKRRGPRNRLAEQYHQSKRPKLDEGATGGFPPTPASISPADTRESAEALAYLSSQGHRPEYAERRQFPEAYNPSNILPYGAQNTTQRQSIDKLLCPKVILDLLVDDFFTYIHPIAPFPHEPSFREAYRKELYFEDSQLLALLASMIGMLVASFPRKPQQHLKAQNMQGEFPKSVDFVSRCHTTATQARGAGYLDKNLTVYDAATSYFLGLAAGYTFEWRRSRLYFSETLSIIRALGVHRSYEPVVPGQNFGSIGVSNGGPDGKINYIEQQIGRRVFYVMLVSVRSLQQLGTTFGELFVPPPTTTEPYPSLPEEVDDEYIFPDRIERQPDGLLAKLVGFNINVKIFSALTKIATMEVAHGVDQVYNWSMQKQILNECYDSVERAMDHIPSELVLKPGASAGEFASPEPSLQNSHHSSDPLENPEKLSRRYLQFEIQKANIYASQLGTRSYIVEKFWNLQEAFDKTSSAPSSWSSQSYAEYTDTTSNSYPHAPGSRGKRLEDRVAQERENIVKELLRVLCSINRVNMEPNGHSFVNKVRLVASTLIETNDTRKGPVAHQAQEFLGRLLDVLVALERTAPARTASNDVDSMQQGISEGEEELAIWADLKEVQMAFLARGGFMATT